MSGLSFIKQYISKPRTVGAILPSSKYLAKKMIHHINFQDAHCIVEYGPGTGVFTQEILAKRKQDTMILLFENNADFYALLQEKYHHEPNLHVICDSAELVGKYLQEYEAPPIDYIVSGLPFASLPGDISRNILTEAAKHLGQGGSFITFQYTLLMKDLIGQFFDEITLTRELRNVPPAYVLSCKKSNCYCSTI